MPSHASILTGVYPNNHKATAHEARLSPAVPFVAEMMKKGGYRTGLFSSNGYVSTKWGFDRGWDQTRNFIRESLPNGADYLWKTTKAWLDLPANKGKPTFLYLATVEPHVIYNPKKEFLAKYWDKPYKGPIKPAISGLQLGQIKIGQAEARRHRQGLPGSPVRRRGHPERFLVRCVHRRSEGAEDLRHQRGHHGVRPRRRVLRAR